MNRQRIIEWAKSGLIALLCASAVLLGAWTGLFNDFFKSIPIFNARRDVLETPTSGPGVILSEAARPAVIVITGDGGGHFGLRYDTGALGRAYERTSAVFGEALGSATPPQTITEDEWRSSLGSPGVYFEYMSPVRLGVLAGWLGVRLAEGLSGYGPRRLCVTFSDAGNTLYFESGGSFYSCQTATPGRQAGLDGYVHNGAQFAFETGADFSFAPYMLILPGTEHPVLSSEVTIPAREMIDAVLSALDVTGQLESNYIWRGDSLLFIGQAFTVTAAPGGRVSLRATSADVNAPVNGDEGQMIELARAIIAGTIGRYSGAATVYSGAIETSSSSLAVTFMYHAAGGIVHLYEDGCAARITFTGGEITEMELVFRTFSETGDTVSLLPEKQALAAAGTEFVLCYPDTGGGYLRPVWVKLSEEE